MKFNKQDQEIRNKVIFLNTNIAALMRERDYFLNALGKYKTYAAFWESLIPNNIGDSNKTEKEEKQEVWDLYKKYFDLYQESLHKESILMKDIISSISIWEFIQQKYFNSKKELWLK